MGGATTQQSRLLVTQIARRTCRWVYRRYPPPKTHTKIRRRLLHFHTDRLSTYRSTENNHIAYHGYRSENNRYGFYPTTSSTINCFQHDTNIHARTLNISPKTLYMVVDACKLLDDEANTRFSRPLPHGHPSLFPPPRQI